VPNERRRDPKFPVAVEQLQSRDKQRQAETSRNLNGFDNTSLLLDRVFRVHPLFLQPTQLPIKTVPRVSIVPRKLSAMADF
jgi:hypothetical protein